MPIYVQTIIYFDLCGAENFPIVPYPLTTEMSCLWGKGLPLTEQFLRGHAADVTK